MAVTHQGPKGTRDFYPDTMAVRRHIEGAWRQASVDCGFDEVEGPTYEHLSLYTAKSGPGIVNELFSFRRAGGDDDYALRPEFTPTLARMVAAKAGSLPMPVKWFAIPVHFRAERQQRGRLREFVQWNVDLMGVEGAAAVERIGTIAEIRRRIIVVHRQEGRDAGEGGSDGGLARSAGLQIAYLRIIGGDEGAAGVAEETIRVEAKAAQHGFGARGTGGGGTNQRGDRLAGTRQHAGQRGGIGAFIGQCGKEGAAGFGHAAGLVGGAVVQRHGGDGGKGGNRGHIGGSGGSGCHKAEQAQRCHHLLGAAKLFGAKLHDSVRPFIRLGTRTSGVHSPESASSAFTLQDYCPFAAGEPG